MPAEAMAQPGKPERGRHDFDAGRGTRDAGDADRAPDRPSDLPKAGWFAILRRSVKQFKHDNVTDYAAALTYFGILAIFPATLALVSVLGLLGKHQTDSLLSNISSIAPSGATSVLKSIITTGAGQGRRSRHCAGCEPGVGALVGLGVRRCVHARLQRDLQRG